MWKNSELKKKLVAKEKWKDLNIKKELKKKVFVKNNFFENIL